MSRIGRKPIAIPNGVTVEVETGLVSVKGPKGELSQTVSREMKITQDERSAADGVEGSEAPVATLTVERPTDRGEHRALHGLTRSLIANMVQGVTEGYEKRLEIQGVGYRARLQGKALELNVGYSHPVSVTRPGGHRVRGAGPDPGRGQGHRQATRRRDRRAHPPLPPA